MSTTATAVQFLQIEVSGTSFFARMEVGKTRVDISINRFALNVCVKNASHRAWRGLGNRFDTVEQALAHYKSAAVKDAIQAAVDRAPRYAVIDRGEDGPGVYSDDDETVAEAVLAFGQSCARARNLLVMDAYRVAGL